MTRRRPYLSSLRTSPYAWTLAAGLLLGATAGLPATALAQDWSVEGDGSRERKIIERYQQLVERTPTEGFAFKQLLAKVGTGRGLERLVAEYRKKVEAKPEATNYRLILGHLLKAQGDFEAALEHYAKAVELSPDEATPWLSRGTAYLGLKKDAEAAKDFEKALELEDDRDRKQEILRKLADIAFTQRDWEGAQGYYDQLVELDPRNEALRSEYAGVLLKYKRYDRALEQYEALLKLAGGDARAKASTLLEMGKVYEEMGKDDQAIATYRRAMGLVRKGNWVERSAREAILEVYRRGDRLAELAAEYEKEWPRPNYDQAMLLARIFDELGDGPKALSYYERASRLNRRSVDPRLKIIQILERRGDDKQVVDAYEELMRIAPRESRYAFDLVRVYMGMGEREEAEKLLGRIARRFRRDTDVQVVLADTYMSFEMKEKARDAYERLVRIEPKNDAFILSLGEFHFQNGDLDEAVKVWTRLLDSQLGEAEAHARLGQVLAEHGMVEKGLGYYEKAVSIAPEDLNVRRGLALAYERGRRWEKAVASWEWLLEHADHAFTANEARSRIINVYRRQNQLRAKMKEYEEAFRATPSDPGAGFFLGEAHVKLGDFDAAEAVYRQLVELARREEGEEAQRLELDALISLETLYGQTGDHEAAIEVLQRLAELVPARSRDYYHRISDLSLKLYEDDQAVRYARMAVELNPNDAAAQARLGQVYAKMQKYDSAVAQYRTAIDLDPRAFDVHLELARILLERGQIAEAEALYRTVATKASDEQVVGQAARRAMSLAELSGDLQGLEAELFPLVYRTPPRPIYRQILLELYDRMSSPLAAKARYGLGGEAEEAARQLQEMGARALPVLIDALQSAETGQRVTAVELLGDMRQTKGALALARLVDDPEEELRMLAAVAVAQIGDPRAAGPLIRVSRSSDPTMRELAIWALGATGGAEATERLAEILEVGQSWREQALAAIGLGRIGTPGAVRALENALPDLGDNRFAEYLQVAIAWGLGRAAQPSSVQRLVEAMNGTSERVANVAAWSLSRIGGDEALRALLETYWSADERIRDRAGRGLVQMAGLGGDAADGEREEEVLREIRREARLVDDRARSVDVERMLTDLERDAAVVLPVDAAAFVAERIDVISDAAALALSDPARRARVVGDLVAPDGLLVLGNLLPAPAAGDAATQQLMRRLVAELHEPLRAMAAEEAAGSGRALVLLGALGRPGDLELVARRLESEDEAVRAQAAAALGGFEAAEVAAKLAPRLRDASWRVRGAAAGALARAEGGEGRSEAVIEALIELLDDDYATVQIAALDALGAWGVDRAIEPIRKRLESSSVPVKLAGLRALRAIGTPEALRLVEAFRRHPDPRVRAAASR